MTDYKELIEMARRAVGSEVLPSVILGMKRADDLLLEMADALEVAEFEAEGAAQIIATERAEVIALRKQLEAATAEQVAVVKPLEWVDLDNGKLRAEVHGYEYEVSRENGYFYWNEFYTDDFGDDFRSAIDAAKSAGVHYERRILSAITLRSAADVEAEAQAKEQAKVIDEVASLLEEAADDWRSDGHDKIAQRILDEIPGIRALHTPARLAVKEGK